MNNTAFWVALALTAIISALATWGITKSYYSGTGATVDTVHVDATPIGPTHFEAPPTQHVAWYPASITHDTLRDTVTLYPQIDTTIEVLVEIQTDSLPPDTISVESSISIAYNRDLNLFRFTQTIPAIHVDLPVRVVTRTLTETRSPLLWWQASIFDGSYSKGVGAAIGITKYSIGWKKLWNSYLPDKSETIWEFGVKFSIL